MPDNLPTLFPDASPNRRDQHIARMQRHSQTLHPQQSKGSRVSHTTRGFFVDTPPAEPAPAGASARKLIVTSVQGDYLTCKEPVSIDSDGVPREVTGEPIYVAKAWHFRKSIWDGHQPSPYGVGIQFDALSGAQAYYFVAVANGGITAAQAMFRAVYTSSAQTTLLRYEAVSPPWNPSPVWSTVSGHPRLSEGDFIDALDYGETQMTVNGVDVTLVDVTPRAWVLIPPRSVQRMTITGIDYANYQMTARPSGSLDTFTVKYPPAFVAPYGSPYTVLAAGVSRRGSNTSNVTGQTQTWDEYISPAYATGQEIIAIPLLDGTWVAMGDGRSWRLQVESNWYCLPGLPNAQVTGDVRGPYSP